MTQRNGKTFHAHDWQKKDFKIVHTTQTINRFNAIPVNIPTAFCLELGKKNPKICIKTQKTKNSQCKLEKQNQEASQFQTPSYITKLQ